jgi:FixJ family two-component response regulator
MHRANHAEELRQAKLRDQLDQLSPTERDVLELTVTGLLDKAIAARMGVSLRTVQLRRASLMKKLDVDSRFELVRIAQTLHASGTV